MLLQVDAIVVVEWSLLLQFLVAAHVALQFLLLVLSAKVLDAAHVALQFLLLVLSAKVLDAAHVAALLLSTKVHNLAGLMADATQALVVDVLILAEFVAVDVES